MTVLIDDKSEDPRTHAFVVGVGEYDYLDDPRIAQFGLNAQLTSPPKSARAFMHFLTDELDNPTAPLGSLAVLISPRSSVQLPRRRAMPGTPTYDRIKSGFRAWIDRCNRNEENTAIFYFCGHGIARNNLALLASDFGDPKDQPLAKAVNFDDCRTAMATTCKARTQCFFADACRSVPRGVLPIGNELGQVIPDWDIPQNLAVDSFGLYASLPTDPAYGLDNKPSAFTAALLRSFRGFGSRQHQGVWWVTTMDLAVGVEAAMDYAQRHEGAPNQAARPYGGSRKSFLHRVADPGQFPVTICLVPDSPHDAELSIREQAGTVARRHGGDVPWEVLVRARQYWGQATFPVGTWQPYETTFTPIPPTCEYAWELQC
jgi:hypothetical protein